MISCVLQGGTGNQLFIMAATISYAIKHGFEYCIPTNVINPHYPLSPDLKQHKFSGVNYCENGKWGIGYVTKYKETTFHYQEIPRLNPNHTVLEGYFQSYKYFDEHRSEILKVFGFDEIPTMFPDLCSIHYRATDYKKYSNHHPVITKEYINDAINHMIVFGYRKFMIFSDDMKEATQLLRELNIPNDMLKFSVCIEPLWELKSMAACGANIIANSTFSWWASYVNPNPNKIVIAPKNWFGPDSAHNDTKDLYYPGTIIL